MTNGILKNNNNRKPSWLGKKIDLEKCHEVQKMLVGLNLHTVCQEAMCPNISECFCQKIATILIMGEVCTRNCSFCAVRKGEPRAVDKDEPARVAAAIKTLGLRHAVITSVTRDDLPDGGAGIFAETISEARKINPETAIEVLVPDFNGNLKAISTVVSAGPDIFAHNVETVPSLYKKIRPAANYSVSIDVLRIAKDYGSAYTKSGIMLGLGEKTYEVLKVFKDLIKAKCDYLSIGQYLAPSRNHYPVKEFIEPKVFEFFKTKALQAGFKHVESAPYVRSSYMADRYGK